MTGMLPTKRATSLAFLLVYLGGQVERSHRKTTHSSPELDQHNQHSQQDQQDHLPSWWIPWD